MRNFMFVIMMFALACSDEPGSYSGFDEDGGPSADSSVDEDCSDTDPCIDPPDNTTCVDENTLGYYDQEINGTCIDEECNYTMQTEVCQWGCITAGEISKCYDPCEGVVCDGPPPDDECFTDGALYTYKPDGLCWVVDENTTECMYTAVYESCDVENGYECIVVPDGDDYCAEE